MSTTCALVVLCFFVLNLLGDVLGVPVSLARVTPSFIDSGGAAVQIITYTPVDSSTTYNVLATTGSHTATFSATYVDGYTLNCTIPSNPGSGVDSTIIQVLNPTDKSNEILITYYTHSTSSAIISPSSLRSTGGNNLTVSGAGFSVSTVATAFIRLSQNSDGSGANLDISASYSNSTFITRVPSDLNAMFVQGISSVYLLLSLNGIYFHSTTQTITVTASSPMKILYLFTGSFGDRGWTDENNEALLAVSTTFGPSVSVSPMFVERLQIIGSQQMSTVMRPVLLNGNYDVLIRALQGEDSFWLKFLSDEFPSVRFLQRGYPDLSTVRYLSGLVAGDVMKDMGIDKVGYICPWQNATYEGAVPIVWTQANAFALGVLEGFPTAKIHIIYTNDFISALKGQQAAQYFVDRGFKILTHHMATIDPVIVAVQNNLMAIGSQSDAYASIGNNLLTGVVQNYDVVDVVLIQAIFDNKTVDTPSTFAEGAVSLAQFSGLVPQHTKTLVRSASSRVSELGTDAFLCGPLYDEHGSLQVLSGSCVNTTVFRVKGMVNEGILDFQYPYHNQNWVGKGLGWAIRCVTIVAMCVGLGIAVFLWKHRRHSVIRYSSFLFCMLMVVGNVTGLAANFIFVADEESYSTDSLDNGCKGLPWIIVVPCVVTLGCLFAKIWRVKKLYNNRQLRRLKITDGQVMSIVLAALVIPVVLLAVGTGVAPLHWLRVTTSVDSYQNPLNSYGVCNNAEFAVFAYLLIGYIILVLVYGCLLAYQTRNVSANFNETQHVAISMISILQICVVLLPLNFLVSNQPVALCVIRSASNFLGNLIVLLVIFVPKIRAVQETVHPLARSTSRPIQDTVMSSDPRMNNVELEHGQGSLSLPVLSKQASSGAHPHHVWLRHLPAMLELPAIALRIDTSHANHESSGESTAISGERPRSVHTD